MKRPIIGITPLFDDKLDSLWMLPAYMNGVQHGGGIPVIIPFSESEEEIDALAQRLDGFLFTGGEDIDPAMYGQGKMALCEKTSACRDNLEKILFKKALKYKKPVLGICRGVQFINVMLGGSLYQDIKTQVVPTSPIIHSQGKPYEVPVHSVEIYSNTPLYSLAGKNGIKVNSLHHQAILRLAETLSPAAIAPDGIVEAVYMPTERFVLGVQWHPELMFENDPVSASIFKALVNASSI